MKNARLFILNGLLLTAVSLLLRTVGVGFNIFITSRVGEAGTGLYQLVMSVYSPALTLASAGVSLASSRLVAEEMGKRRGGRGKDVLLRCMLFSQLSSLPVALLLYLIAPPVSSGWLGNADGAPLLRMMAIGLPFISLSACINGFFIARRRAKNTAAVQLSEQLFKMLLTCLLVYIFRSHPELCLICVVFGNVCSDIFSVAVSLIICRMELRSVGQSAVPSKGISSRILSITLPVSISSFLRSALVALEHILIPKGLIKSGLSYEASMASYGVLSGMAMPIIMFPASFLYSFSSLVVPEMAEANEKGDRDVIISNIKRILSAFLTFSVGAAAVILGFSFELGEAVYRSTSVGKFLFILAPLIPIMYLDNIADSMLKGLGEQIYTMKVNVIDAAACVLSVFFLVPKMGIMGYVAVILISELINFSFSVYRLKKITGVKPGLLLRLPRLVCFSLVSIAVGRALGGFFEGAVPFCILGILAAVISYCALILIYERGIKPSSAPYNGAKKAR